MAEGFIGSLPLNSRKYGWRHSPIVLQSHLPCLLFPIKDQKDLIPQRHFLILFWNCFVFQIQCTSLPFMHTEGYLLLHSATGPHCEGFGRRRPGQRRRPLWSRPSSGLRWTPRANARALPELSVCEAGNARAPRQPPTL